ncbi:MAG: hypothetical protein EOP83_18085, partial [Verrucomicrobiaceae bacterium]
GVTWGNPVAQGDFADGTALQTVMLQPTSNRYVKLVSLSSQTGQAFTTMAEFNLLDNSGNPVSRNGWQASASTQETASENAPASRAIDGQNNTYWHSAWSGATVPFPHEFIIDLGSPGAFYGFSYLPRQDGTNGRIRGYRFYGSEDGISWGNPIAEGNFGSSSALKKVMFTNQANRPPFIAAAPLAFSVTENSPPGTLVGSVNATDPNAGQTLTYSIGSGNTGGAFAIDPATGVIRVAGAINFETRPFYQLQVIAADSASPALAASRIYPITVGNIVEGNTEAVMIALTSPGGAYEGHGNPALTGFTSDPDGDGVSNAIEILLGTDPSIANAQPPIRPVTISEGGQPWLAYEYDLAADSGLVMRCSGSGDMDHWIPLQNQPVLVSVHGNVKTWRVKEDGPIAGSARRFIRLEVVP